MDNLINIVSILRNRMEQYILEELNDRGITDLAISHGTVLMMLQGKKEMNYGELSKRVNKSKQTMTTLVRKLEKENYITINVDKNDKRNKLVSLTTKGEDFIPIMMNISSNMYSIQYKGFTEDEQTLVKTLLNKTIKNFEVQ